MTFSYLSKPGVLQTQILAPDTVPAWVQDRERLWNEVERVERRKDARLAREFTLALPHLLPKEQHWPLVSNFVQKAFVSQGMVADIALHAPNPKGDARNFHAHVLLTTRTIDQHGFGLKNRDWNRREQLLKWRETWADCLNTALKAAGVDERASHLSYQAQGRNRIPQIKLGVAATAMERQGIRTLKGDINRAIAQENLRREEQERKQAEDKRRRQRQQWIEALAREAAELLKQLECYQAEHPKLALQIQYDSGFKVLKLGRTNHNEELVLAWDEREQTWRDGAVRPSKADRGGQLPEDVGKLLQDLQSWHRQARSKKRLSQRQLER